MISHFCRYSFFSLLISIHSNTLLCKPDLTSSSWLMFSSFCNWLGLEGDFTLEIVVCSAPSLTLTLFSFQSTLKSSRTFMRSSCSLSFTCFMYWYSSSPYFLLVPVLKSLSSTSLVRSICLSKSWITFICMSNCRILKIACFSSVLT